MKRTLTIIALLAGTLALRGQAVDTAAQIVDRYLEMLGNDRWPQDSMLVMETVITSPSNADTFVMKRWYIPPQMHRVEVWLNDTLQNGLCSNGKNRFRYFNPTLGYWEDMTPMFFYEKFFNYDFRGPLHGWVSQGATLSYKGPATVMGQEGLKAVRVDVPEKYSRYYFFEPSGLMSMIVETLESDTVSAIIDTAHIDWKFIHEYQQIGHSLLPKQESFLRSGQLTVMETTARLEERKTLIFNQD